jgi:protein-S-isoprenylcysteine O-methyltransferase Ste14
MWFIPFSINLAFWVGICIIVFGHVVFALGYSAMREYPEKKKVVVDWGIYKISRHSHVLAGKITTLGAIVMGWNFNSTMYIVLWVYFVLDIIVSHFAILSEEEINIQQFGQEYEDYMKRVPRYLLMK